MNRQIIKTPTRIRYIEPDDPDSYTNDIYYYPNNNPEYISKSQSDKHNIALSVMFCGTFLLLFVIVSYVGAWADGKTWYMCKHNINNK